MEILNFFFDFLCLAPLSTIFQLFYGDQLFSGGGTTDHGQTTGKLYHLRLRVECTLFVIYTAGREPTSYW
jgi:hypothetical protein